MHRHGGIQRGPDQGNGKKLIRTVRGLLDYPKINCEQCDENLKVDGVAPSCQECHIARMTPIEARAINLFYAAGSDGLTHQSLAMTLQLQNVPRYDWPDYFRLVRLIQTEVKKHAQPKSRHRANGQR